ncbi:MAG: hypothetical protein WBD20_14855 [Pirellulaceae bacterium]
MQDALLQTTDRHQQDNRLNHPSNRDVRNEIQALRLGVMLLDRKQVDSNDRIEIIAELNQSLDRLLELVKPL